MKKVLSLLLSITMLLSITAGLDLNAYAQALTGSCGENVTYTLDTETGVLTISGTGEMYDYSFSTNAPWYSNRSSVKTVEIEYGVTSIGDCAFDYFTSLTSVTIPNSVTSIGEWAFCDCSSLTNITIPNSVTSIGTGAFCNCISLTSITIPNSVTSIGEEAFESCSSLTSVTIPNSVTSIGDCAFRNCRSLTSITVDSNNQYYSSQDGVLFNKEKTTLIQYPIVNTRTSYTIPNSVTSIGDYAFYYCRSLTSVTIPDSVTSIGNYAFAYCRSLTSVTIPDSVTSIGNYAFYDCRSLTSVTIPDSVTFIGRLAFSNCISLTSITVDSNNQYYSSQDGVLFNKEKTTLIQYPIGNTRTSYTIPNSVTSIGDWAFCYCSSLTSVIIPDSVTIIGNGAFSGCSRLTSVTIPNSVTSIGYCAFESCSSLTSVTIGNSVTSIGDYEFSGCSSLTSITIPNSVTSIGWYAFENCSSLTSITIPDSVTSIGSYAFYNCSSLTSVTIPDSVTSIGWYAFENCSSLIDITIPNSVTSIDYGAFSNCSSLTNVTIPDSVTDIGDCAFDGCNSLTNVIIGNGVTSLNGFDFTGCSSLKSVTIGNSVTSISDCAFEGCSSLTSVTIGSSVTSIGSDAFYGCSSLTSITIPDSVTNIGYYAFGGCENLASVTVSDTCWNELQIESGNDDLIWAKYGSTITEILSDEVYFDYNENEFEKITNSLLLQKINEKLSSHGININTNTNTVTINGKVYESSSYVISPRGFYAPYYGIDGRLTIFGHEIAVPIDYKNSDDYNKNDEQYIKNLAISSPKYYEVEFDYLNKNNIWENFFETVNSYYENLINDASVEIKSSSGAGGAEGGINLSTYESGTVICIFKNGVFYDSRIMGEEIEVPVINVPDTIPESEINSYVINLIEETYPNENRSVSDIIEGTKGFGVDIPDGYTVLFEYVHENGEHDFYENYIIIKKPNSNPPMQNPQDNTSQTTQPAQSQGNTPADTQQGVQSTQSTQDVSVTTQQPNTQPISQVNETTTAAPATTAKKPKSTSIKKLTKGKKSFKITFKKITGISGYQVQYATDKKFKKNKKTVTVKKSKTSTTVKKLKANKKYYVRVRTYKTVNGKKVYSTWSKVKTVKTK